MCTLTRCITGCLVVLAMSPTLVRAQVLFERPDSWTTDVHQPTPGLEIDDNNSTASQFTLGSSATVGGVRFWARQSAGFSDPGLINWWIYLQPTLGGFPNFNAGPGAALVSGNATTTRTVLGSTDGFTNYEYTFALPSLLLTSGVFWLALNVNSAVNTGSLLWDFGQFINDTHVVHSTTVDDFSNSGLLHLTTMRYQILADPPTTVTPEPAAILLFGFGLAAVAATRRRRRQYH